jgi:hypothetical protein
MSSQPIRVEVQKKGGCLSGCATIFAVVLVIGLAVTYWYVAVPIAVVGLIAGGIYWNSQRSQAPGIPAPAAPAAPLSQSARTPAAPTNAPSPARQDALEQLRRLGELRDSGVITDSEFEAKKAELLKRI